MHYDSTRRELTIDAEPRRCDVCSGNALLFDIWVPSLTDVRFVCWPCATRLAATTGEVQIEIDVQVVAGAKGAPPSLRISPPGAREFITITADKLRASAACSEPIGLDHLLKVVRGGRDGN